MSERTRTATAEGQTPTAVIASTSLPAVTPAPAATVIPFWTVERLLYAVALAAAGALRLWALGANALSTWEASNSWPAWLAAHALRVADTPTPNSPIYYAWQWLIFFLGVNTDGGARFLSAVVGTALVVLPWWWRGWLGRRAALILAFLWALDPWQIAFSRMADGAAVAMAVGLLWMVATTQVAYGGEGRSRWRRVFGAAAGLLVVSGPMGLNLVVPCALLIYLLREPLREAGAFSTKSLLWAVGAALGVGTFLGARLDGLAWLAAGGSVWLAQFDGGDPGPMLPLTSGVYGGLWPWLRAAVDMAAPFLLGLAGFMVLWRRGERMPIQRPLVVLLLGWIAWGVLLWLLPGRGPFALPVLGLPLTILAAIWLDNLIQARPQSLDWREAGAVVLTLLILITSGLFWMTGWLSPRVYDPAAAQAAAVIFGLTLAILVAFGVWANRQDALWIGAALMAVLLMVWTVRGGWRLNYGDVVSEPAGWQWSVAHPELSILADDIETLSAHRTGDPFEQPVQIQIAARPEQDVRVVPARPDPVLGWRLRDMRELTWVTAPNVAEDAEVRPLVVTPVVGNEVSENVALPGGYGGSIYHVESSWLPGSLTVDVATLPPLGEETTWGARLTQWVRPWWRWLIYREATQMPAARDVALWAPFE